MKRDEKTTDLLVSVAKNINSLDRIAPRELPSAVSFLEDLQKKILHEGATTGDELIDYLVGCYGAFLSGRDIKRFHVLDTKVRAVAGESVLVIYRERGRRKEGLNSVGPYAVRTTYYKGTLDEGGLQTNLRQGSCVLPAQEHIQITSIPMGEISTSKGGILINKAFDPYSDDGLSSIAAIGRYIDLRNDPDRTFAKDAEYVDAAAKAEIEKGSLQVVLGTKEVAAWIENDELARACFERLA